MLRHVDLCSGIGGFSLGFHWAELSKPILFCDTEEWCRKILAKNFPNVPIAKDVKELANDPERLVPDHDILSCGYPCQPFSVAGLRKAEKDDRHIWPSIFRIIAQKRPSWVVCENVYGHIALGLDKVLTDLESEGYTTRTFVVPACSKNAPHRRDRLWIIARNVGDTEYNGSSSTQIGGVNEENAGGSQKGEIQTKQFEGTSGRKNHEIVENTNDHGYERGQFETRNETIARQDTQSLWSTNSDLTVRRGNDGGDIKKSRIDDGLSRLSDDGATKSSSPERVRGIHEVADEHQGVGRKDRYQENDNRALVQEGQIGFQPSKYRGLGKDQASFERDQIRQGDDNNREQRMEELEGRSSQSTISPMADSECLGWFERSEIQEEFDREGSSDKFDFSSEGRTRSRTSSSMADSNCERLQGSEETRNIEECRTDSNQFSTRHGGTSDVADTNCKRTSRRKNMAGSNAENVRQSSRFGEDKNIWFVEPNVGRVAHGISKRVDRLKGLGNAIVPQIAMQIGLAIKNERS